MALPAPPPVEPSRLGSRRGHATPDCVPLLRGRPLPRLQVQSQSDSGLATQSSQLRATPAVLAKPKLFESLQARRTMAYFLLGPDLEEVHGKRRLPIGIQTFRKIRAEVATTSQLLTPSAARRGRTTSCVPPALWQEPVHPAQGADRGQRAAVRGFTSTTGIGRCAIRCCDSALAAATAWHVETNSATGCSVGPV